MEISLLNLNTLFESNNCSMVFDAIILMVLIGETFSRVKMDTRVCRYRARFPPTPTRTEFVENVCIKPP